MANKKGKVHLVDGIAYAIGKNGKRIGFDTWQEAQDYESKCFGPNSCTNTFTLPVNDAASTAEYPAKFEFVKVGTDVVLRVTVDFGAGPIIKEVTLT